MALELLAQPDIATTEHLANKLITELRMREATITFVEGATGGGLLTDFTNPGVSRVLECGYIPYSRSAKEQFGVPAEKIDRFGEYSPYTANVMAQLGLQKTRSTYAIATVGNIGEEDPLRWAYVACANRTGKTWGAQVFLEDSDRQRMKALLSAFAFAHGLLFVRGQQRLEGTGGGEIVHSVRPHQMSQNTEAVSVVHRLARLGLRVRTMESCTGGAVANAFSDCEGASAVFDGGIVAYSADAKYNNGVEVARNLMDYGGVYSHPVAVAMARAVLKDADIGIGTTGVLDTPDTRLWHEDARPGVVHIAIVRKKFPDVVRTLTIPMHARRVMKKLVVDRIFNLLSEMFSPVFEQHYVSD